MKQYIKGAKQTHKIKTIYLGDLKFDPTLHDGYKKIQPLEPDLIKAQELIKWANKIVLFYPIWWTTSPAILKGFFDRTILPAFAYKFTSPYNWKKLLKEKSARLIVTMDSPWLYYKFIIGDPNYKQIKGTLGFCGISPIKKTGSSTDIFFPCIINSFIFLLGYLQYLSQTLFLHHILIY